jgi:hypothetical protein
MTRKKEKPEDWEYLQPDGRPALTSTQQEQLIHWSWMRRCGMTPDGSPIFPPKPEEPPCTTP